MDQLRSQMIHLVQVASLRYRKYMDKKTTDTIRNSMVMIHRVKQRVLMIIMKKNN